MSSESKPVHWADQTAVRILAEKPGKEKIVVASGITPSGVVHIGNFREAITVELVARGLRDRGAQVDFLYSWDDFDTFRKVPVNFPKQEELKAEMRKPINRVLDPFEKSESYAAHNEQAFEKDLSRIGIQPRFVYQAKAYESGAYAKQVREALENKDKIAEILNKHRSEPLAKTWLPTSIYCEQCDRDSVEEQTYLGEWDYSYKCSNCGHSATTDIRKTKNLKLSWRTDWPMRWAFEGVDFEPGGKDHSSEGGSFDTAKEIVAQVWGAKAPSYLRYDFVTIKGRGAKMSSSKGDLITLSEALSVYSPQLVRWIFSSQRPNHDFALAFDEDVIKTHDEFDRAEALALGPVPEKLGKYPVVRRAYELSLVDPGQIAAKPFFRPSFRELCNRLQVFDGDISKTIEKFYAKDLEGDLLADSCFKERAKCAWNWLEDYAPEEFKYRIRKTADLSSWSTDSLKKARELFVSLLRESPVESLDAKTLSDQLYEKVIHGSGCEPKEFFLATYQALIGREKGPRLPSFLKEIGTQRLLSLLEN